MGASEYTLWKQKPFIPGMKQGMKHRYETGCENSVWKWCENGRCEIVWKQPRQMPMKLHTLFKHASSMGQDVAVDFQCSPDTFLWDLGSGWISGNWYKKLVWENGVKQHVRNGMKRQYKNDMKMTTKMMVWNDGMKQGYETVVWKQVWKQGRVSAETDHCFSDAPI